jgi:uncharacterized protein YfaS (alpha-2-macroglobulin family)
VAAQAGTVETAQGNQEPLAVVDWGPQGLFSSTVQRPQIYLVFSQPMTALAALGAPSASSPVLSIEPALKGVFRWYGTSFLSFEAAEPCRSQQVYTITVNPNAASIWGNKISGQRVFSFHTEALAISEVRPGDAFRKQTGMSFSLNEVPPEAAREISIKFNYPVQAGDIRPYLEISTGLGGLKAFSLRQVSDYELLAALTGVVEFDTPVFVILKQGAKSAGASFGIEADQVVVFRTPGPFAVTGLDRGYPYGKYRNIIDIDFSIRLNGATAAGAVRIEPAMDLGPDHLEVIGNIIRLYNLPLNYGETLGVYISRDLKDIFGRSLGAGAYKGSITMPPEPPPVGTARFLDYGNAMLEAQFAPRFLFEHTNILEGSFYTIRAMDAPDAQAQERRVDLAVGERGYRYFEEIDLGSYLSRGRGSVYFKADLRLPTEWKASGTQEKTPDGFRIYRSTNELRLQVTDLGLTVRYGFNKTVVLVTSLSTGEPVEGALVRLISPWPFVSQNGQTDLLWEVQESDSIGGAMTGKDGLAVIGLGASVLREATVNRNNSYYQPWVSAEKDGDRAVFSPNSHNSWSFGVSSRSTQLAEQVNPVVFMFSDRGLYKPGETLSFRGVDRSLVLGMYLIYRGDYAVALEEDRYQGQTIASLSGTVTGSGGFYGSLEVPADLAPGAYRLVYRRGSALGTIIANIPITVAFFERLKFQASIAPPQTVLISGDEISMSLSASYLSGGSLSGAGWEAGWYRELSWFSPGTSGTEGFSFGPRSSYDAKHYIAAGSGALSGEGKAALSQKTGSEGSLGAPYRYSVEVRVTDLSNQMIAASSSVLVHPARFYIGLASDRKAGFAKAGEEITFHYITVTTAGEKTAGQELFLQTSSGAAEAGILSVELLREEWRRVQQQGVGGYIYDEYIQEMIADSASKIKLTGQGGSFTVRPSKAGFYVLRLSAKDREGRTVLTEYSFYVTGSGGGYWNMNSAEELRLTPDKSLYNPGDTAQLLLQSPLPSGQYLITVEREGIFTEEVRYFEDAVNVIEIPIARNYVPVVYVAVSSYSVRSGPPAHEYGEADLDKPKGYFGLARLSVNPQVRSFSVSLEADKPSYRPGEEVTLTLMATQDGRSLPNAEITLMVVDRGVLDLINYHVPDPIAYFYDESRFPLAVQGGDSRALLMDPVTYSVKNLAGGDADGDSKIEERKDFNPTAVFLPMLITGDDGKVTASFKLPDSLTTYRVTAFGVRGDNFSIKESEILVQSRINVREILPRRLRERDTAEAGVLVTNMDAAAHTVKLRLDIAGTGTIKGAAQVDGVAEREVRVPAGGSAAVYFDLAALSAGTVELSFTVNSDILNEKLKVPLTIERPYVKETVSAAGTVRDGESSAAEMLVIPSFADNGVGSMSVSLDATRLALLDSAVDYLFHYPYGCMEQRSAAMLPLVIFGDYLNVFSLRNEVANPRQVVESELIYWAQVQLAGGGFPYWPSRQEPDYYVSLRIAQIIALARGKGIVIPAGLDTAKLGNYLSAEYQRLQSLRPASPGYYAQSYLQVYTLYVFSLLGAPVDSSKLAEILSRQNVDASVLAFAGMAYRNLGRDSEAAEAARRLRNLMRYTLRGVDITDPLAKSRYSYYGNTLEQLALALEFFAAQAPGDELNTRLLHSLLEQKRSGGFWDSTAVTVRVLSAVDALIRSENLADIDVSGTVRLGSAELLSGAFKGMGAKPVSVGFDFKQPPLSALLRDAALPLTISRQGRGALYYTASLTYAIPAELQGYRDEGLGVYFGIYDIDTGEEIPGTALESGKTYRAKLQVSSRMDRSWVALRAPIPSGAEVLDTAFVTTASYAGREGEAEGDYRHQLSHQVILDNEVQFFWDNFEKGETTLSFLFRAVRRGVYPTPPAQAECMYEGEIFGRSSGALYTIR